MLPNFELNIEFTVHSYYSSGIFDRSNGIDNLHDWKIKIKSETIKSTAFCMFWGKKKTNRVHFCLYRRRLGTTEKYHFLKAKSGPKRWNKQEARTELHVGKKKKMHDNQGQFGCCFVFLICTHYTFSSSKNNWLTQKNSVSTF